MAIDERPSTYLDAKIFDAQTFFRGLFVTCKLMDITWISTDEDHLEVALESLVSILKSRRSAGDPHISRFPELKANTSDLVRLEAAISSTFDSGIADRGQRTGRGIRIIAPRELTERALSVFTDGEQLTLSYCTDAFIPVNRLFTPPPREVA